MLVVGDDALGAAVVRELHIAGQAIRVLCRHRDDPVAAAAMEVGAEVVVGHPARPGTLEQAGVTDARACAFTCSDEVANFHGALVASDLAPQGRVVLRLRDTVLAGGITDLVGDSVVLAPPELAAPAFVEAAVPGAAAPTVGVGDRVLAVADVAAGDGRIAAVLGDASAAPRPGTRETVLALVDVTDERARGRTPAARARRVAGPFALLRRGFEVLLDPRVLAFGGAAAAFILISAVVFDLTLGISLLKALYFATATVTTIGYGDISFGDAPPLMIVYGIGFMLFGALALAVVFALATDAILGTRLREALGQYRVPERGHVVVCGVGHTGRRVIEELTAAGIACVAIESDDGAPELAPVRRLRVPVVIGDASSEATLRAARAQSARALLALTDQDIVNLQTGLVARAENPRLRIVLRLLDPDLALRVERAAGISLSRSPLGIAAPAFVVAMLGMRPGIALPVGARVMQVATLRLPRDTTSAALSRRDDAIVVAVGDRLGPAAEGELPAGTRVTAVGTVAGLAGLLVDDAG